MMRDDGRCRWRLCDDRVTETFTMPAPGYRWNGILLAPGEQIGLCPVHSQALREHAYEWQLPDGCGALTDALRLPFDILTR